MRFFFWNRAGFNKAHSGEFHCLQNCIRYVTNLRVYLLKKKKYHIASLQQELDLLCLIWSSCRVAFSKCLICSIPLFSNWYLKE